MRQQNLDLRRIVYVLYDTDRKTDRKTGRKTDRRSEPELEMMRGRPDITVIDASTQNELIAALRIPSSLTIISSHGFHDPDDRFWGLSCYDRVTPPLRPSDLFELAGDVGAANLIVLACDSRWSRHASSTVTPASAEWGRTDTRGARVFITQGEIRYTASRGFLQRLLRLIDDEPNGDLAELVFKARERFGRTLKPQTGRVRIIELAHHG